MEWIVLESLLVVDEGEGKTVAGLAYELEVNELAEATNLCLPLIVKTDFV